MKGKIDIETSELPLSTKRFNLRIEIAVRQTQTVAWQENRVNIVMKSYALTDTQYLNYTFIFRDRESVKVFHNNVNLVYLLICSLP